MTLRPIVSHVARRFPFIAAGYLGSCSAATFAGLFIAALINSGKPKSAPIAIPSP